MSRQLFKLFRSNLIHKEATYFQGLNVWTEPFNKYVKNPNTCGFTVFELSNVYSDLHDRFEYEWNIPPILAPFHWIAPIHACADSQILPHKQQQCLKMNTFEIKQMYPIHKVFNGTIQLGPEMSNSLEHRTAAVNSYGLSLRLIAEKYKTPQLCLDAVQQNGMAIEFVPTHLQTFAMWKIALKNDGMALQFLHDPVYELCFHATQLYWIAILQNGMALEFVPKHKQTDELCRAAIRQDAYAITFVVNSTDELLLYADTQRYIQFGKSRG